MPIILRWLELIMTFFGNAPCSIFVYSLFIIYQGQTRRSAPTKTYNTGTLEAEKLASVNLNELSRTLI